MRFDRESVAQARLQRMTDSLQHRGPDDEGFCHRPGLGFGHRRLAIIDPVGSIQPMLSQDGRHVLIFNGEIFNYRELRADLIRAGEKFETDGDSEVVLRLLMLRGMACVEELNGQFAIAYYNEAEDTVSLARDRLGIRPLFYSEQPGEFVFASEIKAIRAGVAKDFEIDLTSVDRFLSDRYVPAPRTMFAGVSAVMPGHTMVIRRDGSVSQAQYWKFPGQDAEIQITEQDAIDQTRALLESSVSMRLIADVPVGVMLSGGIDSSLITALVKRARAGGEVLSYSAGFEGDTHSEHSHARVVSEAIGTTHYETSVNVDDLIELWPRLSHFRDAPVSQASDVAIFDVARLAGQSVKVLLSGEGSDELFAGYPKHKADNFLRPIALLPAAIRTRLFKAVEQRVPSSRTKLRTLSRVLAGRTTAERIGSWFASFTWYERQALRQEFGALLNEDTWAATDGDHLRRHLHRDCHGWLDANLLARGDRMLLGNSVEGRVPFLDHRLAELAASLPSNVRRPGKTIVKAVARSLVPDSIIDRAKWGFKAPLGDWMRGPLREFLHDHLLSNDAYVQSVFNREPIEALLKSHVQGRDESLRIWTLLSLEVWHRTLAQERCTV